MIDESSPGDLKSYQTTRDNPIVSEAPRRHVSLFTNILKKSNVKYDQLAHPDAPRVHPLSMSIRIDPVWMDSRRVGMRELIILYTRLLEDLIEKSAAADGELQRR